MMSNDEWACHWLLHWNVHLDGSLPPCSGVYRKTTINAYEDMLHLSIFVVPLARVIKFRTWILNLGTVDNRAR